MNTHQSKGIVLLLLILIGAPMYLHGITITPVTGSPFTDLPNYFGAGLCYSPNGQWLACANSDEPGSVSIYAVASNGVITQITGSPFVTHGLEPDCVAYSPDGQFLVVGNYLSNNSGGLLSTISLFSVNQSTGALTQLDPSTGSSSPATLETAGYDLETIYYSPNGKFIAAALSNNTNYGEVGMYTVNSSTGALTLAGTFPTTHPLDDDVSDEIAFSPDSNYIAQANSDGTNTITIFTVDQSTGVLGPNNEGVYGTDYTVTEGAGFFSGIAYSPNGKLLVVSDTHDNLFTFTLNNGVPTYAATIAPASYISGDTSVVFSPDSQLIALANDQDTYIYVFSVTENGAMTQVAQLSAIENITDVVFSPTLNDPISFLSACGSTASPSTRGRFPLTGGAIASYIVPVASSSPSSPTNVTATRTRNIFLLQTDLINLITWGAPTSGSPVTYNIYRDPALTQLIGIVPATSPLQFYDHDRQPNVTYTYYITAVDGSGNNSLPSIVSIVG